MQIRSDVLFKGASRQTDKQRRKHNLIGGGNKLLKHFCTVVMSVRKRSLSEVSLQFWSSIVNVVNVNEEHI